MSSFSIAKLLVDVFFNDVKLFKPHKGYYDSGSEYSFYGYELNQEEAEEYDREIGRMDGFQR
jgi:hypothetical protein